MGVLSLHPGVVNFDDSGGTLRDISDQVTDITLNVEKNIGGFFVIGEDWEQQSQGGKRGMGDIEFVETQGTNEAHQLFRDYVISGSGTRTLRADAPDSLTGSMRYSGETVVSGISPIHKSTGGSGDPVKSRAAFKIHGALSASVIT